ncbi:MAG TPA: hypothetical protein VLJ88_03865 [Propionibacteriaceae bacterium]|nr:hypothetical protein [Propionibacteriaceae bacterium]
MITTDNYVRFSRVDAVVETPGDGLAQFARERFALVLHGAAPETIQVDGSEVSGTDGRFEWPNRGAGFVAAFTA